MELGLGITGIVALLGLWGSLWYKLGKLSSEVRNHNQMLHRIEKQIEHIFILGGKRHG